MSNDAQPEIRFPGFTDDWEQRKLGEVADIIGGGTPNTNNPEYWNGDIDWYAPAEIGKQIYVKNSQKKISQLGLQKSSAKILPIGTVLFTSRAGIGNTAILAKEGTTNQGFQSIVPHENKLDSYFIFSRTHELKRYGEVTGAGSTFAEVSGKQMAKMPILIPYIDEQQKIGIFFKKLDDTITLHQRTLDLLKETKKGFLQKMFPKNGAKVPEIRFPGFTEDWEERKLGDITKISTGKLDANAMVENGKYDFYTSGIKKYRIDVAAFEGPSITIAGNGATVGYMHLADNKFNAYQRTYVLQEFLVDRSFIFSEIGNKLPKKIKQEARTGNIPYIVMDMLTELKLSIPQNNSEQQKIGTFFKQLDDTITLHQRKLDLLKETKKGFLQK
ncbi:TPA: restriction endonuclease subunit S, partial [Enterococcus faecium]|nr:restriction endonuclease subunit S [Enterococcus faecium]